MTALIGVDLGTSSAKCGLFALDGALLGAGEAPYPLYRPAPGWAEQDPADWWRAVGEAIRGALTCAGARPGDVAGLAFSGQMQGTLALDAAGQPLGRALIWLDGRAEAEARFVTRGAVRVMGYGLVRLVRWLWLANGCPSLTGTDPIAKMAWLRRRRPELWARCALLLDARDYLILRATGRAVATWDNGNLTWLMDTRAGHRDWSDTLLRYAGVPRARLPALLQCHEIAGHLTAGAAADLGLAAGLPVVAGAGDVAAMAVGAGALASRVVHVGLGTSAWVAAHVDGRRLDVPGYVASMCSAYPGREIVVGAQQAGGACLDWARAQLAADAPPLSHQRFETLLTESPPGARGALFLPWLAGERTPIDDPHARGGFLGLRLEHTSADLARAVAEGVAHNVRWALARVERLCGGPALELRLAGGATRSDALCQILADVFGRPVARVERPELAAARGAALVAAFGLGFEPRFEALAAHTPVERTFSPDPRQRATHDRRHDLFAEAYARLKPWFALAARG